MNNQNLKGTSKQKGVHELEEIGWITLYLVVFFSCLYTYSMLLLNEYDIEHSAFRYGLALVNALVLAKIILIGEYAGLGKRQENKPLILSVFYKTVLFTVLVAAFHGLEELVKVLVFHDQFRFRPDEMLIRNLVVFCGLVPFFALWELRRVLGEGSLPGVFLRKGTKVGSEVSGRAQNSQKAEIAPGAP